MSIEVETSTIDYTADGVASSYAIPYAYLDSAHVKVYVGATVGTLVLKAEGTDYTIDAGPQDAGVGNVDMNTVPTSTHIVRVRRVVPLTQPTDLRAQGTYAPSSVENALDRLEMQIQQLNDGTISVDSYVAGAPVGSTAATSVEATGDTAGVSTSASRLDHKHKASTAAPLAVVGVNSSSPAVGTATTLARSDHAHGIVMSAATPAAVGTAAVGTSLVPARDDHVHAHGNQAAGDTMHAVVSTTVNGFMDADDKVKLDAIVNPLNEFLDDFVGGSTITDTGSAHDKWDVTLVGTGTITPSTTEEYGAVDIVTSAGGTDSVMLTSGLLATPQRVMKFACRIKVPSVAAIRVQVGLTTSTALAEFDQFDLDPENHTGSTNWFYETDRGSTQSANSAVAVSGAWQELEFVQSADTSVAFYINGTLVGTHSTAADMPDKTVPLRAFIKVTNTSAAAKTITVDFIRVRWAGSGRATTLVT